MQKNHKILSPSPFCLQRRGTPHPRYTTRSMSRRCIRTFNHSCVARHEAGINNGAGLGFRRWLDDSSTTLQRCCIVELSLMYR